MAGVGSGPDPGKVLAGRLGLPAARAAGVDAELATMILERLAALEDRAAVDDLTGSLRRGAGADALEREVQRALRHDGGNLAIAFVDVDALKEVNDSRGHLAGDEALKELAAAFRRRLRRYDLVVRWGGDEFVIALSRTGPAQAANILAEVESDFSTRTGLHFDHGLAAVQAGDTAGAAVTRADADLYSRRRGSRRDSAGESTQKRQGRAAHSPA